MRIVTVMRSQPAWRSRAALKDQLVSTRSERRYGCPRSRWAAGSYRSSRTSRTTWPTWPGRAGRTRRSERPERRGWTKRRSGAAAQSR
jgi:hypothetical protein